MRYLYTKEMITFTTACIINIFWFYAFNFLKYVECFLHVIVLHLVFNFFSIFIPSLERFFPFHLCQIFLNFFQSLILKHFYILYIKNFDSSQIYFGIGVKWGLKF